MHNQPTLCVYGQRGDCSLDLGYYLEPRLNFNSRFFVAPGFRLDGGSGGNHASYSAGGGATTGAATGLIALSAFPKIDFSWVAVDRQQGRPLFGALTLLRPRLAFGFAGTQPDPASRLRLFNVGLAGYSLESRQHRPVDASDLCSHPLPGREQDIHVRSLPQYPREHTVAARSARAKSKGVDATLWQNRLTLTYTLYNKTRHDAILTIPIAPSVDISGAGSTSIAKNIGIVKNTGTELTADALVFQSRALGWHVGVNLSRDHNVLVRLNPGQAPFCTSGDLLTFGSGCLVPGFPLFGEWVRPIRLFVDANHDGLIESQEIRLADSAIYAGEPNPNYELNLNTDFTLLNGRLSFHATFAYQDGMTQDNSAALNSGLFSQLTPKSPLVFQAAVNAGICTPPGTPRPTRQV